MVTVAKSFDAPIKLLFPKNLFDPLREPGKGLSMLGLGDIVLPGKYHNHMYYINDNIL
jgi:minor histocompatibility antigen H13